MEATLGGSRPLWEPTLSAVDVCGNLARCRRVADKVGSHQTSPIEPPRAAAWPGSANNFSSSCESSQECDSHPDVQIHRAESLRLARNRPKPLLHHVFEAKTRFILNLVRRRTCIRHIRWVGSGA